MTANATSWRVTVLLADSAQVADGKLYILGGGWSLCGPGAFAHALALKLEVPWDQANRQHRVRAVLKDEDSQEVLLGDPPSELVIESQFEVGRPVGLPPGTSLDVPLAINVGPIELPSGRGFFWSISIDGDEVQRASFRVRPSR